jgi:hypothetical protein
MSDLVRRLSIPNEIAVFMWKPFLLPGENQRDYENASPNDDRRHPAKAALKEAKSSADSVISNGGAVWSIKFHCGLRHLSGLAQQDWVSSGKSEIPTVRIHDPSYSAALTSASFTEARRRLVWA